MGLTGIEPALPKELDPKSSASASSATAPNSRSKRVKRVYPTGPAVPARFYVFGKLIPGRPRQASDRPFRLCMLVNSSAEISLHRVYARAAQPAVSTGHPKNVGSSRYTKLVQVWKESPFTGTNKNSPERFLNFRKKGDRDLRGNEVPVCRIFEARGSRLQSDVRVRPSPTLCSSLADETE